MPPRVNIADAVLRLAKAAGRPPEMKRCLSAIARSLKADGDEGGAALILERIDSIDRGTFVQVMGGEKRELLRWYDPADPIEPLFLDGAAEARMHRVVRELKATPALIAAGIDPSTRIFLTGPSGTGKTLATRWLGRQLGLPVAIARLDTLVKSYLGQTSENIAKVFDEALGSPSVLMLDEVDAITGVRGDDGDKTTAEMGRVTSTVLQRLDLLPPEQIVVAVTNLPDKVDSALRRRLPLCMEFGAPTPMARVAMAEAWLAKADVGSAVKRELVEASEGMSGAEFRALVMDRARSIVLGRTDRATGPAPATHQLNLMPTETS